MSFPDSPAWLLAPKYWDWLFNGWAMTLWVSLLTIVAATALGMVLAVARRADRPWVVRVAGAYLSLFRNSPLLVQLLFWYFGLPALLPEGLISWLNAGHSVSLAGLSLRVPSFEFLAALTGLVCYSAAYVGEEIRAGLNGVPAGQTMAATALGMRRWQVLRHVVLPQALHLAMGPLLGQYMNIVKNTSLAMAIGLVELSYTARQVEAETFQAFQVFGIATTLYVLTVFALQGLESVLQRRQRVPS